MENFNCYCGTKKESYTSFIRHLSTCKECKSSRSRDLESAWNDFLETSEKDIFEDNPKSVLDLKERFIIFLERKELPVIQFIPQAAMRKDIDTGFLYFFVRDRMVAYFKNDQDKIEQYKSRCHKQRVQKIEATCLERYGVLNPGQLPAHKEAMKRTTKSEGKCNPFSTYEFGLLEFIKGKRCHPKDQEEFNTYKFKVNQLTQKNKDLLPKDEVCYYTGLPIYHVKTYNDTFKATIDHKISILDGFYRKIPAEIIAGVDNLCWTSRIFNCNLKKEMSEKDIRLSGIIEKFKDCYKALEN